MAFAFAGEQSISKLEQQTIFHIEKGPVAAALIQFSRQAEMQIVLAPDSAANATASPVNGRLAAGAALTALLRGTGLVYTTVGNTVMVQQSENENKGSPTDELPRSKI